MRPGQVMSVLIITYIYFLSLFHPHLPAYASLTFSNSTYGVTLIMIRRWGGILLEPENVFVAFAKPIIFFLRKRIKTCLPESELEFYFCRGHDHE